MTKRQSPWQAKDAEIAALRAEIERLRVSPMLYYRKDTGRGEVHVWKEVWSSDMFERLTSEEFAQLKKLCERFTISLTECEL